MAGGGPAISESRLRAYFKCSQFFHYGGEVENDLMTSLAQHAIEYYLSARLRQPDKEHAFLLSKSVLSASRTFKLHNQLENKKQELERHLTLWLGEFFNTYKPGVYLPVTGPLPWNAKVSNTTVRLQISGVFRTAKYQTLHVLSFSPYHLKHSHLNDPILHLKARALKDFVKKNHTRPQVIVHMLRAGHNGMLVHNYLTTSMLNPQYMDMITQKVKLMEQDVHMPILPCPYACPYKKTCYPGVKQ